MSPENKTSRIAGLLYLIVVLTGIFSLAYVPSQIHVDGDPKATVANIISMAPLFRRGIASMLVNQLAFLLLPFVLYKLLRVVNKDAAVAMVALAIMSVPITLAALFHRIDVLTLIDNSSYSKAFTPEQVQAAIMLAMDSYRNGLLVTDLFWGLWLLPFGYLVFKSGFLPRLLGVLLMLGCAGYLVHVFGNLLVPHYEDMMVASFALMPSAIGEIGICVWLLAVGARPRRP